MIEVFQKGEGVGIYWEIQDWEDNYINPSQGAKITIWSPNGALAKDYDDTDLTGKSMANDDTGKYSFTYYSHADDAVGWWSVLCVATDGTGATAKVRREFGSFEIK
jgi:hypothetical protein